MPKSVCRKFENDFAMESEIETSRRVAMESKICPKTFRNNLELIFLKYLLNNF